MHQYYLYILASRHHRHLSIGVTTDLVAGISTHRLMTSRRLGRKRVLQKLVYVEAINCVEEAVARETELSRASRQRLVQLVESVNPGWDSISLRKLTSAGFHR